MRLALSVVVIAVIGVILVGCTKRQAQNVERKDVVDRDFVATIRKTKEPYVFEINVRKVYKTVEKDIGSFPVMADLALRDNSGKVFSGQSRETPETPIYAREVGEVFDALRPYGARSLTGKVRLLADDLPPGKYVVQPRVRVHEGGKDLVRGPYDSGTVAVPAGNSVEVEIR